MFSATQSVFILIQMVALQSNGTIFSTHPHVTTLFRKKIYVQFCDSIGIRIYLEDATIGEIGYALKDSAIHHSTSTPFPSTAKVRSDVRDGFMDWIKFHNSTSIAWDAIQGSVNSLHISTPYAISVSYILAKQS